VTSELEWREMFSELRNSDIIKIYVMEGNKGRYYKDGPAPEILYSYTDTINKTPETAPEEYRTSVPRCLEQLFLQNKILPHNIPTFLEGIVTIHNQPNNQVDLDVDVEKLKDVLHRKGFGLMDEKEYGKARSMFRALLIIKPEDPITSYNVACTESLLGNYEDAIYFLKQAIDFGYDDVDHLLDDDDFINIRSTPGFGEVVNYIKEKLEASLPPKPIEIEEDSVEPVNTHNHPEILPVPSLPVFVAPVVPKEPVKAPLETKWAHELDVLHEMGFIDDDENISLLESSNGSVEQTVIALLNA